MPLPVQHTAPVILKAAAAERPKRKGRDRLLHDGTIEIDNSAAERALRGIAIGRRNYLFAGADSGGDH